MFTLDDWLHIPTRWFQVSRTTHELLVPLQFRRLLTRDWNLYISLFISTKDAKESLYTPDNDDLPTPAALTPVMYLDYTRAHGGLSLVLETNMEIQNWNSAGEGIRQLEYDFFNAVTQAGIPYRITKSDFPASFLKLPTQLDQAPFQYPTVSRRVIRELARRVDLFLHLRCGYLTPNTSEHKLDTLTASMLFHTRVVTNLYKTIHTIYPEFWYHRETARLVLERTGYSHERCRDDFIERMTAGLGGTPGLQSWIREQEAAEENSDLPELDEILRAANYWKDQPS